MNHLEGEGATARTQRYWESAGLPRRTAAMRVRVSQPDLASDLLHFLRRRVDVVAAEVGRGELEISLLGSRREPFNRVEIDSRVQDWQQAHPDVDVEFVDQT